MTTFDTSTQRPEMKISDPLLEPIAEKVREGERISVTEGLQLYETNDIWTL